MRIAIDIDGVIRDSVWKMVELYNNYFSTNLQVDDVEFYDVEKSFPLLKECGIDPYKFFFDDHDMDVNFESYCFDGVIPAIKKGTPTRSFYSSYNISTNFEEQNKYY